MSSTTHFRFPPSFLFWGAGVLETPASPSTRLWGRRSEASAGSKAFLAASEARAKDAGRWAHGPMGRWAKGGGGGGGGDGQPWGARFDACLGPFWFKCGREAVTFVIWADRGCLFF